MLQEHRPAGLIVFHEATQAYYNMAALEMAPAAAIVFVITPL